MDRTILTRPRAMERGRLRTLWTGAALILLCIYAPEASAQVPAKQDPREIHAAIRQTAREFVATDSSVLERPSFTVNGSTRRLDYTLGRIRPDRSLGLDDSDPYSPIFEAQIRIEALRRSYAASRAGDSIVRVPLERADSLVYRMITDVLAAQSDTGGVPTTLPLRLQQRGDSVDAEFSAIATGIREYAAGQGLNARRVGDRYPASATFSVRVSSNPQGGTIALLEYLQYRKLTMLGQNPDLLPWRTVAQQKQDLVGRYMYRIQWPTGTRQEGQIQVRNNSDITLPTP
jgi:hypothetical protein